VGSPRPNLKIPTACRKRGVKCISLAKCWNGSRWQTYAHESAPVMTRKRKAAKNR